ncbi:MAG: hypothetical protein OXG98_04300 [Gemmatimonadetes bacterium]|nr:hypothetical protein [Gemmatimonadota bacterium]
MGYPRIDGRRVQVESLADRASKHHIDDIRVDPDGQLPPATSRQTSQIGTIADRMRDARSRGASVMLAYGAHLVKNGLAPVVTRMMEDGWVTHLATNGAGVIHDWEYAFHGRSEEDVRDHVARGRFGTWDETGRHTALAVLAGTADGLGYGESVGRMIVEDGYHIPDPAALRQALVDWSADPADDEAMPARADLLQTIVRHGIAPGRHAVEHPHKQHSLTGNACRLGVPLTVHPGIGYDIVYTHPLAGGGAYGRGGMIDFQVFAEGVSRIDGGVFLSVGSSIMAPQVFEKSVSIANNLRRQDGLGPVRPFIAVNDLTEEDWDWNAGEPPMDDPAYYNRMGKSFSRMGGELIYVAADNRLFIPHLCRILTS